MDNGMQKENLVLDNTKKPFIWFKAKDKGVERGFLGVKVSELQKRLKDLHLTLDLTSDYNYIIDANKLNSIIRSFKRIKENKSSQTKIKNINLNDNFILMSDPQKKFILLVIILILQSKNINKENKTKKIQKVVKHYTDYCQLVQELKISNGIKEIEFQQEDTEMKQSISVSKKDINTSKKNYEKSLETQIKQKFKKLVNLLVEYDNSLLANNIINPTKFDKEFIEIHKELQNKKLQKNKIKLQGLKPEYIIKGDNVKFAGMSIPGVTIKNIIRNIAEDGGKGPDTNNKNIITEFFALKFAQFLGGKSPKNTYILKDKYEDGTEKLMLASKLHENFNDFQGKLIDSNTNTAQIGNQNYNRLTLNRQTIEHNGETIKLKDDFDKNGNINTEDTGITTALLVLSILNDLDGVGAQGQNIGYNTNGDILFFDFGHSFENTNNLGAGLCPQLGSGNVKSRNIASFFAGIPLKNQLKILKNTLNKFNSDEFDEFVETIRDSFNNSNIETDYDNQIDIIKYKILERIEYIKEIFGNRLEVLKDQHGDDIIDVLDNLQLLIFNKTISKYSKNGVILKEGTKYFDIKKLDEDMYLISLEGKSKYNKDKSYEKEFIKLIKEFRGHGKDPYVFSKSELLDFKKFVLSKRFDDITKLNNKRINDTIRKEYNSVKIDRTNDNIDYIKRRMNHLISSTKKIKNFKDIVSEYEKKLGKVQYLEKNIENILKANQEDKIISEKQLAAMVDAYNNANNDMDTKLQNIFNQNHINNYNGINIDITSVNKETGFMQFKIIDGYGEQNDFEQYKNYTVEIYNLPKNFSVNHVIANLRTHGLKKGIKKMGMLTKVKMFDNNNINIVIPSCFNMTQNCIVK